jgi:hypothetical protein
MSAQIYGVLSKEEKLAAQRIFLKPVEIGGNEESGTEWKSVRRRAPRSEFDSELEQRVLMQLSNAIAIDFVKIFLCFVNMAQRKL